MTNSNSRTVTFVGVNPINKNNEYRRPQPIYTTVNLTIGWMDGWMDRICVLCDSPDVTLFTMKNVVCNGLSCTDLPEVLV